MGNSGITRKIIRREVKVPYIDEEGNVSYMDDRIKHCLVVEEKDGNSKQVSKDYYYMKQVDCDGLEDFYIVCDANADHLLELEFHPKGYDYLSRLVTKYGIIALQRDENGNIIPMAEKVIVPFIYDEIRGDNDKVLKANVGDKYTYIDIDPSSVNFGKQLVPCVLTHAVPFSTEYAGFAQCSVDGRICYLPRNCKHLTKLSDDDLLTEDEVKHILSLLNMCNSPFHGSSVDKIAKLSDSGKVLSLGRRADS